VSHSRLGELQRVGYRAPSGSATGHLVGGAAYGQELPEGKVSHLERSVSCSGSACGLVGSISVLGVDF
jgi:hypothetical protein